MGVVAGISLSEQVVASKETIRKFVKDLAEVAESIKDAREDRNEAIKTNDEVQRIDDQIKTLREERRDYIKANPVIQGYEEVLREAMEDRRQLIADAKQDGVPRKEVDTAIKMLKKDIDPEIAVEMYANIADLVD
jgi:SMC interacting uncharacterized protein involved in chromosome segregation